ncbi:MAG: hypothetical protein ACE5OZ_14420 [Candidatus Heimdallarchaeota archaeon]
MKKAKVNSLHLLVLMLSVSLIAVSQQPALAHMNSASTTHGKDKGFNSKLFSFDVNAGPTKSWGAVITENYWYSRYYLGNAVMMSGMGLHMAFNPTFQGNMTKMMMKVSSAANLTHGGPAANAWVIFAEFGSKTPQFAQQVDTTNSDKDFATLRWDLTGADKDLYPAALGMAGLKNVMWSEDFFRANHFVANGTETQLAPNTSPTQNATDSGATIALGLGPTSSTDWNSQGFRGFVLLAEVINKMMLLKGILATNIETGNLDMGLDPMTNAADYYFPHRYTYDVNMVVPEGHPMNMAMPKPENYSVVDSASTLWDQLSLLWMSARFHRWSADSAQDDVFGANGMGQQPFPGPMAETGSPGPEDLSKGLASVVWQTLINHHWDSTAKTFVDTATYSTGSLTAGNTVSTINAGLTIAAVEEWSQATNNMFSQNTYITDQADFLIDHLQNQSDGGFANSYDLSTMSASTSARTLETQAGAIRGLLAAYQVSNDAKYKAAALFAFDFLEKYLWDNANGIYKSSEGATTYSFTPKSIGVVSGALREILALNDALTSPIAHYRYTQFFENAVDKSGFQQSEGAPTGGQDDNDGIPAPPMQTANGATFGTAPMPAGEVQFSTATAQWSVADYTFYTDEGFYAANEFMWSGLRQSFVEDYSAPTESFAEAVLKYQANGESEQESDSDSAPGFGIFILASVLASLAFARKIIIRRNRKA